MITGTEIRADHRKINDNSILTCCVPRTLATKFAKDAMVWLAFLNGLFGSTQQVLVKSLIELLKISVDGRNQMHYALTYLLGFFALLFAAAQFRILNYGLEKFDQIKYVPMYSANIILTGVTSAWFLLDDAEDLNWNQILFFVGGGGITIVGVCVSFLFLPISPSILFLSLTKNAYTHSGTFVAGSSKSQTLFVVQWPAPIQRSQRRRGVIYYSRDGRDDTEESKERK